MKQTFHAAESRGHADHGWLNSFHTFSFANYHNAQRMNFGSLRVLNDDVIFPAKGFGTHPHNNMEIISIAISGSLRHQDSMGHQHIIQPGEVQIMSAGTGITHSEYNHSSAENTNFLQIWVLPDKLNIQPRYGQKYFNYREQPNKLHLVISPDQQADSLLINQNAYFSLGTLLPQTKMTYTKYNTNHGVYFFLIEGSAEIASHNMSARDGLGIEEADNLAIHITEAATLLVMEVPMM